MSCTPFIPAVTPEQRAAGFQSYHRRGRNVYYRRRNGKAMETVKIVCASVSLAKKYRAMPYIVVMLNEIA